MSRWSKLSKKLNDAIDSTVGHTKMSSGDVSVNFMPDGRVMVSIGAYDIADWPRHLDLGPFKSEEQALKAFENLIKAAVILLGKEKDDD